MPARAHHDSKANKLRNPDNFKPEQVKNVSSVLNASLVESLRAAHEVTDEAGDCATTSMIENWIDESERRSWFLFEASR